MSVKCVANLRLSEEEAERVRRTFPDLSLSQVVRRAVRELLVKEERELAFLEQARRLERLGP